jgi:hypothetical protein
LNRLIRERGSRGRSGAAVVTVRAHGKNERDALSISLVKLVTLTALGLPSLDTAILVLGTLRTIDIVRV